VNVIVDATNRIEMPTLAVDDPTDVGIQLLPELHMQQRPPILRPKDDVIFQERVR
jgi:hypothetical protein